MNRRARVDDLDRLFSPNSVVVIGASSQEGRIGHTVLRKLLQYGYPGDVFAVNPKADAILGSECFASIAEAPSNIDLAIVCVPAAAVADAVRDAADAGVGAAVIITDDLGRDPRLPGPLRDLAEVVQSRDIRVLGPNTVGYTSLQADGTGIWASFRRHRGVPGLPGLDSGVAIVGQGGGLTSHLGETMLRDRMVTPLTIWLLRRRSARSGSSSRAHEAVPSSSGPFARSRPPARRWSCFLSPGRRKAAAPPACTPGPSPAGWTS